MKIVENVFVFMVLMDLFSMAFAAVDENLEILDPLLARYLLANDFEDGTMSPWFDQSPGKINWKLETFDSPSELNSPVPQPASGAKYLNRNGSHVPFVRALSHGFVSRPQNFLLEM